MKMDAKAAAEAIKDHVDPDHAEKQPSENHHALAFISEVADHLGMEANVANITHIAQVLTRHGIDQYNADEFPKWADVEAVNHHDLDYLHTTVGSGRVHVDRHNKKVSVMFDGPDEMDHFKTEHGHIWRFK